MIIPNNQPTNYQPQHSISLAESHYTKYQFVVQNLIKFKNLEDRVNYLNREYSQTNDPEVKVKILNLARVVGLVRNVRGQCQGSDVTY